MPFKRLHLFSAAILTICLSTPVTVLAVNHHYPDQNQHRNALQGRNNPPGLPGNSGRPDCSGGLSACLGMGNRNNPPGPPLLGCTPGQIDTFVERVTCRLWSLTGRY